MYSKSLLLLLVCFVAATMLLAGCGNDAEQPAETTTANKPEPKPKPPVTPKAPKPATKPPATPKAPTTAIKPPATRKTPTTAIKPPARPKAATLTKIKTGWSDARVGTMVKYKMQNNMTLTQEVIKVTDEAVTVKMTTSMPAMPNPIVRNQDFPRYGKPGPDGKPPEMNVKGKKLADQTLTVAGKPIKCEVWETVMEAGDKKITSKTYFSKEIPGWTVKTESDTTGAMATVMELVEFKK